MGNIDRRKGTLATLYIPQPEPPPLFSDGTISATAKTTCETILLGFEMLTAKNILLNGEIKMDYYKNTENAISIKRQLTDNRKIWKKHKSSIMFERFEALEGLLDAIKKKQFEEILKIYYRAQHQHVLGKTKSQMKVPIYVNKLNLNEKWIPSIDSAIECINIATPGLLLYKTDYANESQIFIDNHKDSESACTSTAPRSVYIYLGSECKGDFQDTANHKLREAVAFKHKIQTFHGSRVPIYINKSNLNKKWISSISSAVECFNIANKDVLLYETDNANESEILIDKNRYYESECTSTTQCKAYVYLGSNWQGDFQGTAAFELLDALSFKHEIEFLGYLRRVFQNTANLQLRYALSSQHKMGPFNLTRVPIYINKSHLNKELITCIYTAFKCINNAIPDFLLYETNDENESEIFIDNNTDSESKCTSTTQSKAYIYLGSNWQRDFQWRIAHELLYALSFKHEISFSNSIRAFQVTTHLELPLGLFFQGKIGTIVPIYINKSNLSTELITCILTAFKYINNANLDFYLYESNDNNESEILIDNNTDSESVCTLTSKGKAYIYLGSNWHGDFQCRVAQKLLHALSFKHETSFFNLTRVFKDTTLFQLIHALCFQHEMDPLNLTRVPVYINKSNLNKKWIPCIYTAVICINNAVPNFLLYETNDETESEICIDNYTDYGSQCTWTTKDVIYLGSNWQGDFQDRAARELLNAFRFKHEVRALNLTRVPIYINKSNLNEKWLPCIYSAVKCINNAIPDLQLYETMVENESEIFIDNNTDSECKSIQQRQVFIYLGSKWQGDFQCKANRELLHALTFKHAMYVYGRTVVPIYLNKSDLNKEWIPCISSAVKSIIMDLGLLLYVTDNKNESEIFIDNNRNSEKSDISTTRKRTYIYLGSNWQGDFQGTATHELLHALGFNHEMQRRDADLYLNFNINKDDENAAQYNKSEQGSLTRFDPFSVLMYPENSKMVRKREDSIWEMKPNTDRCQELSELNKVALNLVYEPVISDQYTPKISEQTGMLYCGRKVMDQHNQCSPPTTDGRCGPNNWANCPACRVIKSIIIPKTDESPEKITKIEKIDRCIAENKWQGLSGLFYCGNRYSEKFYTTRNGSTAESDGVCGFDNGIPCTECGDMLYPGYSLEMWKPIY